jgi:hypothetical protein
LAGEGWWVLESFLLLLFLLLNAYVGVWDHCVQDREGVRLARAALVQLESKLLGRESRGGGVLLNDCIGCMSGCAENFITDLNPNQGHSLIYQGG